MKHKPKHPKNPKSGAAPPHFPGGIPIHSLPASIPVFPMTTTPPPAAQPPAQPQQPDVRPDETTYVKSVRDIATAAWKLKNIVFKPGTDEPAGALDAKQLADIGFYAERLYNTLETLGVTVLDFTGQPFEGEMPVKVISAKPTPGLEQEVIFQTILPTIKFTRTNEFYPGNVITLKRDDETSTPAKPKPESLKT